MDGFGSLCRSKKKSATIKSLAGSDPPCIFSIRSVLFSKHSSKNFIVMFQKGIFEEKTGKRVHEKKTHSERSAGDVCGGILLLESSAAIHSGGHRRKRTNEKTRGRSSNTFENCMQWHSSIRRVIQRDQNCVSCTAIIASYHPGVRRW